MDEEVWLSTQVMRGPNAFSGSSTGVQVLVFHLCYLNRKRMLLILDLSSYRRCSSQRSVRGRIVVKVTDTVDSVALMSSEMIDGVGSRVPYLLLSSSIKGPASGPSSTDYGVGK